MTLPGVTVVAVGKLRERYFAEACAEYTKRLGAFCRCNVVEVAQCRLPASPSPAQVRQALAAEARDIATRLPKAAYCIPLCVEGKHLTSEALAQKLGEVLPVSPELAFLIGSSHGLDEELKRQGHLRLSLSAMTLPHQLARVVLLEQVYRAFCILENRKYHK